MRRTGVVGLVLCLGIAAGCPEPTRQADAAAKPIRGDGGADARFTVGDASIHDALSRDSRGKDAGGLDLRGRDLEGLDQRVGQSDPDDPANATLDSDCDGLTDAEEMGNTYAGGGQTDPDDPDSDGDGIDDGVELGRTATPDPRCAFFFSGDADPGTTTDPTRADSDGDGLADGAEDLNGDGAFDRGQETDPRHPDTDRDGLCDGPTSVAPLCTGGDPDPLVPQGAGDRDGDGLPDAVDAAPDDPDRDGDGLCDGPASVAGVCAAGEDRNADGVVNTGETDPARADSDCDGLADGAEAQLGTNPRARDSDGDLIPDGVEAGVTAAADPDGCGEIALDVDGVPTTDPMSKDSDGDGINDGIEDANRNGRRDPGETDPADPDSDGDGLCDGPGTVAGVCVAGEDLNANGRVDFGETDPGIANAADGGRSDAADPSDPDNSAKDSDCDGLSDAEEFATIYAGGGQTSPTNPDSDGDGILDGVEVGRTRSPAEACAGFSGDANPASTTSPTKADSDGDGLSDGQEDANHNGRRDAGELDPRNPDTDGDGLCDGANTVLPVCVGGDPNPFAAVTDADGDGLPDATDPAPTNPDRDGDGLCDGPNAVAGTCVAGEDLNADGVVGAAETDPDRIDTDCDGVSDGEERALGLNPRKADSDGDLISDGVELGRTDNLDEVHCPGFAGDADPDTTTDPLRRDSDGDGLNDGLEDADHDGQRDAGETDPRDADSDGDGICDGPPRAIAGVCTGGEDLNGNGVVDVGETDPRVDQAAVDAGTPDVDPYDPQNAYTDSDCDGLSDQEELANTYAGGARTDPRDPDSDGDGLSDGLELGRTRSPDVRCVDFVGDASPTTHTDPTVADWDGDGLLDGEEDANQNGRVDPGETNPRDPDADNDGLCDGPLSVPPVCTGGDPEPLIDARTQDTDGDGLLDTVEQAVDGLDPADPDSDGDGLCDGPVAVSGCAAGEDLNADGVVNAGETDPTTVDTDCDGVADGEERTLGLDPRRADSDGDLIPDGVELGRTQNLDEARCPGFRADADGVAATDPKVRDSDGDGINDGVEDADRDGQRDPGETDPADPDTDDDGLCDGPGTVSGTCVAGEDLNANGRVDLGESDPLVANVDTDLDGIDDLEEPGYGTDPADPDSDDDGLLDGEEVFTTLTEPMHPDTDCDGVADGAEVDQGLDPLSPDSDGDGLWDGVELGLTVNLDWEACPDFRGDADGHADTDPLNPDSDGDGVLDGTEDANQNGRTDPGELDPTDPDDVGAAVADACALDRLRPVTLVKRGGALADLVLAVSEEFPLAHITALQVSGDARGAMVFSPTGQVAAVALKIASGLAGPGLIDKLNQVEALAGAAGSASGRLTQTFTTWDGHAAVSARYSYVDSGGGTVGEAANDLVAAVLGSGVSGLLSGAALGTDQGPFHLRLELVDRAPDATVVVAALVNEAAFGAEELRLFQVLDLTNGSALAQFGDTTGVQCDRMTVQPSQKIDFIWIVDNSGSMDNEQTATATAAQQMAAQLDRTTADWRIAVLTSDVDYETNSWNNWRDEAFHLRGSGSPKYCRFTRDATVFQDCVESVGINGSGAENFFRPAACLMGAGASGGGWPAAVDGRRHCGRDQDRAPYADGYAPPPSNSTWSFPMLPRSATENASKIRQGAAVAFVFLSDANEQSDGRYAASAGTPVPAGSLDKIPLWVSFFNNFDGQGTDLSTAFVAGILCPAGEDCSDESGPYMNTRWPTFLAAMGGVEAALPNDDDPLQAEKIQAAIAQILDLAVAQASPYVLSKPPISATIKVAVSGATAGTCDIHDVPRSRVHGFDYDGANNSINFYGDCRPQDLGAELAVSYRYWTDLTADPDGGDQPGDCPEPLLWVDGECKCPADCGVGAIPPAQVCDTSACQLVCRPDCGGSCAGAATCDAAPGVCACACPADCGGAAPGPGFVCDRDAGSPTFCQWVCAACPGAPAQPSMTCDLATCAWTCPGCDDCPGQARCSEATCQCDCVQTLSCGGGTAWDNVACDCVCDAPALGCEAPEVADTQACACVCPADCGGLCGTGGTCNTSLCACLCPPDCGVADIPPERSCDTSTCQLVCRPDCGGTCPGAAVCNPSASVCACECPADCGGPPPSASFTCQRDPSQPGFCEYLCEACPGEPTNPLMTCDRAVCAWACPDCAGCPGLSTCSDETCQCECQQQLSCGNGFVWDEAACDCVCDGDALGCSANYQVDPQLCACVCGPDCNGNCGEGTVCQQSRCACVCPADCGVDEIPPERTCDTSTCQLVCRPDCGGACGGSSSCNADPAICACECPADCGGAAPAPGFVCDRTPGSPTYCQWVCTDCAGEAPNPLMVCDRDLCAWRCPDCGACPGLATCGQDSCVCECNLTLACPPGHVWDDIACDCVCDAAQLSCGARYDPDPSLCACVCGANCNDQCPVGFVCNESTCSCRPQGG